MGYDVEAFRAAFLGGADFPIAIAETGWRIDALEASRSRAAVDVFASGPDGRLRIFVERRVDGAASLARTKSLMLSHYAQGGCDDARAASVVHSLAALLEARERALGDEAMARGLRVERHRTRTTPMSAVELRINRECNEHCLFCNTPEDSDTILPGPEAIFTAIDREREAGRRDVTFTGREPTLDPNLPAYLRRARERGYEVRRVQTNGTTLARREVRRALVEAGLTHVDVSLHTLDRDTFKTLVGAPSLIAKTLEGLRRLDEDHPEVLIVVIMVMTTLNLDQLAPALARLAREVPGMFGVTISPVAPVADARKHLHLVPRLRTLAAPLARMLDIAERAGLDAVVPSRCGAPLCAMPRGYEHFNEEIRNLPGRTADAGKSKAPLCEGCACNSICTGVWSAQLEMHGDGELQPFAEMPAARTSTRG